MQIHVSNDKQCRSGSVGFFRCQLIWIYTLFKGRVYQSSAGQGLKNADIHYILQRLFYNIYLIFDPDISNSICIHDLSPALWSSLFIFTGAKYGYLAS